MKLTSFQREIVDRIITGEVYDIPSYLQVFGKGQEQQYDPTMIQATFDECENGMTYMFKEVEYSFYTDIYDQTGYLANTLPVANKTTIELKSCPISKPVKAELEMTISPEVVSWGDKTFKLDFLKNKYLVADSFVEIRDFVALWSYLRREALVFEGNKLVTEDDLSIFFNLKDQQLHPPLNPYWQRVTTFILGTENDLNPRLDIRMVPQKIANNYLKRAWKFNQEQFAMCKDYIGIKMMPTSELKNYQQSRYRTVEEKSQKRNLFAAWAAVAISLISVLIGNILPLFQKTDIDYLSYMTQQITSIEEKIDGDTSWQEVCSKLDAVYTELTDISDVIEQNSSENLRKTAEELIAQIEELKSVLAENQNDE